jgi:hypothetical protein
MITTFFAERCYQWLKKEITILIKEGKNDEFNKYLDCYTVMETKI